MKRLLLPIAVAAYCGVIASTASAATPLAMDRTADPSIQPVSAAIEHAMPVPKPALETVQFHTDRRVNTRRYVYNRNRSFRRNRRGIRLKGGGSAYGPAKFTHGQAYYGGHNILNTRTRNGYPGRRIRRFDRRGIR
ncbi:MAG: hypothetical protein AAGK23_07235 [Pseudomonadota bacterium]